MPKADRSQELFILFNPRSGSHEEDARPVMEEALRAAGRPYRFITLEKGNVPAICREAARLAAENDGVLVCVGGDGTINTAAQAAYAHDCVFAVIAQGTFNIFARENGLPLEVGQGIRSVLDSEVRDVQVGMANQQVFLVNTVVGLYAKLLADREEAKKRFGRKRWVALFAAIHTFFGWRYRMSLDAEIDGETRRIVTPSLFVCNNRLQLERLGIEGDLLASVGRGFLCGIVSTPLDTMAKLRLMARALFGRLGDAPEIDSFALRSLTVGNRFARRMRVGIDGEVRWMELPLHIAIAPKPLRVLLPSTGREPPTFES